ncbi:MAG: hypothetical protein ACOYNY_20370 [Caldilineaceae bacterium]
MTMTEKKPMGRPKTVEDHGKVLSTRVPTPMRATFDAAAKERGITPAQLLRTMVVEWVAQQAEQSE